MKLSDIFRTRTSGVSFEFFPPRTVEGKDGFLQVVKELAAFDPLYVSVSYGAGGTTQDRTLSTLKWLKQETDLSLMSHLTCVGATHASMDALLQQFKALGLENILALRGDPPKNAPGFDPCRGEFCYAKDLIEFIKQYGYFSMAVAVYPEVHKQSPSADKDIEFTKQKIDAGADIAITQMFFDNRFFYEFRERALRQGIRIPILPGIMPIIDCKRIKQFASFCNTSIPREVLDRLEPVMDLPEETRKRGVEFAIRQCEDLMKNGVRYIHFYSLNRADSVSEILKALHLKL